MENNLNKDLLTRINNKNEEVEAKSASDNRIAPRSASFESIFIRSEIAELSWEEQFKYFSEKQGDKFPSNSYEELLDQLVFSEVYINSLKQRYNEMKKDLEILQELLKENLK